MSDSEKPTKRPLTDEQKATEKRLLIVLLSVICLLLSFFCLRAFLPKERVYSKQESKETEKMLVLQTDAANTDAMIEGLYRGYVQPEDLHERYQKIWSDYLAKKLPPAEQKHYDELIERVKESEFQNQN